LVPLLESGVVSATVQNSEDKSVFRIIIPEISYLQRQGVHHKIVIIIFDHHVGVLVYRSTVAGVVYYKEEFAFVLFLCMFDASDLLPGKEDIQGTLFGVTIDELVHLKAIALSELNRSFSVFKDRVELGLARTRNHGHDFVVSFENIFFIKGLHHCLLAFAID